MTGMAQTCPELETLAAYVEGKLPPAARDEVTQHLAGCERCYELVVEVEAAADANRSAASEPVPGDPGGLARGTGVLDLRRAPRSPWWRSRAAALTAAGGSLAAAALLVLSFVQPSWWAVQRGPDLAALIDATREERTVEARLTGGFAAAPLRSPTRSGSGPGLANLDLRLAAAQLEQAAQEDPRPERLHAWGVAQLTLGQVDGAIETLEGVAARLPGDARVASDLSAAYAERARTLGQPEDWTRALAAADRAIALDPVLAEAYFNRALALGGAGRAVEARAAWVAYQSLDRGSDWTNEARQRRDSLRSP
jgi:tetratricopeptide (TPR) repeat protein